MPDKKPEQKGVIDRFFESLFNGMGFGGADAYREAHQQKPQAKPKERVMSDKEMRARGFSEDDIRYVRELEKRGR